MVNGQVVGFFLVLAVFGVAAVLVLGELVVSAFVDWRRKRRAR